MRRSALFSLAATLAASLGIAAAQGLRRDGDLWIQNFSGSEKATAGSGLRVNAHGPVTITADGTDTVSFSVDVGVRGRTEADARRVLSSFGLRVARAGGWITLTAPRGPAVVSVNLTVPRHLRQAIVSTSDGRVEAGTLNFPIQIDSGAGALRLDRSSASAKLITSGGSITVGTIDGTLNAVTLGGPITVKSARGQAVLETAGGDIVVEEIMGMLRANTAGGAIRVGNAGAAATLTTAGGPIVVNRAKGIITARNAAGPVQVGAAGGLQCETGSGGVVVANISGMMRVSTAAGNIFANLLAGGLQQSFLTTGNGDITVLIPSNLGVTIRAENEMADTLRRIISEFPGIPVRMRGSQVVAEGPINGGGPLLQISGAGGTIFIKRQQ
jgi:DUF4097 and DUF4098 domain-containing protein YvlB